MPFTPKRNLRAEELYQDPSFVSLSREARYLLVGLLQYVDGQGREKAKAQVLRETFFEMDDDVSKHNVESWLLELAETGWVALYTVERRELLQVDPVRLSAFVAGMEKRNGRFPPPPEAHRTFTGPPSGAPRAEGREGAEWWQEDADAWMEDPELPPPVGCPRHPSGLLTGNCGPCGSARKLHDSFMRGEISHSAVVAAHRARPARPDPVDDA